MINLQNDLKITPEDTKFQELLRREKRVLNFEEYLAFLQFAQDLLGVQFLKKKVIKQTATRQFEL